MPRTFEGLNVQYIGEFFIIDNSISLFYQCVSTHILMRSDLEYGGFFAPWRRVL